LTVQLLAPLTPDPRAPLARTNPLAWIGAALIVMLFGFAAVDAVTAGGILLAVLAAIPLSGVPPLRLLRRARVLLWAAVAIGLFNALFGEASGRVVLSLGPVALHAGNLATGAALGLRVLGIALAGVVALASVDPTDLADALVQELRMPARFALGALAAMRLAPLLTDEWQLLGLARRARGVAGGTPVGWLRLEGSRLMSLLVGAIRRSTRLARAMEARGLSGGARSVARPQRFTARDRMVLLAALAAGALATTFSILLGTYRSLLG
jgi:energy-coupling factor transport system permease protein